MAARLCSDPSPSRVPDTGYPDSIVIDGIPLLDRVWLDRSL
jgi:hypothetical protein